MNDQTAGAPAPTPDCAPVAPLLPLLRAGDLSAAEEERVRAHLVACAWCRGQLAAFDIVDAGMRRVFGTSADAQPFLREADLLRALATESKPNPPTALAPAISGSRRGRLVPSSLAALAAVLLLALGFSLLFHSLQRRPLVAATATVSLSPTASPSPSPTSAPNVPGPPFTIYYLGTDGSVYALRSTDLSTLWQTPAAEYVQFMALSGNALYLEEVTSSGLDLRAFSATDGSQLWRLDLPQGDYGTGGLAAGNGYVAYTDGTTLHVLHANDGSRAWQRRMSTPPPTSAGGPSQPVIVGGVVYASDTEASGGNTSTTTLYALRASDGSVQWSRPIATPVGESVVSGGDYYYLSAGGISYPSNGGTVYALSLADGHQVWSFQPANERNTFTGFAPVVAGGTLYLLTTADLYALRATSGHILWQDGISLPPTYAPVAVGNRVFVTGPAPSATYGVEGSSFIYAVNATDGNELWENHDNYGWAGPPIANSSGDTLWAFGSPELAVLHAQTGVVFAAATLPAAANGEVPILTGP